MKAVRRAIKYVKHDLKEIAWPSSLPDPPDYKPPRKLSLKEKWQCVKAGHRDYVDSWKTKQPSNEEETKEPKEPTLTEEFVMAAKSAQGMRPVLLKIYYRQMTAYQLSIKAFIEGYKEGVKQPVDLDFILDEWEKATAPDKQQPPESAAQKADASQAERPSDSIEKATSTQVGRLENPRDSAHGEAKPGRGVRNDVNRQAQRGQEREVDMMSASDIDEWNARIMAESSQTSESGSKLQSASLDKQSDGHRSSTTGSDAETSADQQVSRMTLTEPRLPSTSNKNVEPATSFEQDISDALAEAERLARLMQKGTITPQQMRDFQKAVARADVMLSNAR